jgi:hypothetical protein
MGYEVKTMVRVFVLGYTFAGDWDTQILVLVGEDI